MTTTNFSPRFVKAKVKFRLGEENFDAGEHLINSSGVPAFKWAQFEPMEHIGKRCWVFCSVQSDPTFQFNCDAVLTAEESFNSIALGIQFLLPSAETERLNNIIAKEGVLPDYVRKFPRIVFNQSVGVMPSRAIMSQTLGDEKVSLAVDIADISPSGIQVATEDMRCALAILNEAWSIQIQPRGNFAIPVSFSGEIKRITHSVDPLSGNSRRYFSFRISQIADSQKIAFTDLLRQIVTQFRPQRK